MVGQAPELIDTDDERSHKAYQEHNGTQETEDVHRLLTERRKEPQRQQIQVAVHKTVQPHELRRAVLAGLVLHHLLANLRKASLLGQIGNVAVHLAVHLNVLHHRFTVGLQAAVEVVQVLDATDLAGRSVKQLRGQRLRQRVVALLLVAAHQVIALLGNHLVQSGNLVRGILQVGIHRDNHIALGLSKTAVERRTLAVVAAELDALHNVGLLLVKFRDDIPRTVGRAVVDKYHFIRKMVGLHHPLYPCVELGNRLVLIIKRYYY